MKKGKVYLVGAGPGDPELITVKGKRVLEEAEVVIYDRLVGDGILSYVGRDVERVFVGKEDSFHTMPQEEINRLIVDKAKTGRIVVRLKGGDPYIFGRGGEEAFLLGEEGIPFEVVPGVTAASGVAAYAGIPLTDRRHSSAVTLVTGHKRAGCDMEEVNWKALAQLDSTIVFYMGIKNLETITANLIDNGRSADTPAAVVRRGTLPEQETVVGTLDNIAQKVEEARLRPPALLVVGEVVGLRASLGWFEKAVIKKEGIA
ncbi:MAG: uroporphyrinogen-III C-methyltransferase [bacterium]|nr:uroporphyrinogen-III C-methyltransferase [bacterium]